MATLTEIVRAAAERFDQRPAYHASIETRAELKRASMSIKEFTVDRARWGQGALLNNGKMCCLGFLSEACGIALSRFGMRGYPDPEWTEVPEVFRHPRGRWRDAPGRTAANINDGQDEDSEKESKLIALFAKHGIKLSFTGESCPS